MLTEANTALTLQAVYLARLPDLPELQVKLHFRLTYVLTNTHTYNHTHTHTHTRGKFLVEPLKWRATHLRGGKIKSGVISSSWKLEVCFAGRVSGGEETVEPPELTAETHCWKLLTHTTKVFAEHTNFTPRRLLSSPLSLSGNLTSDTAAAAAAAAASSSSVHLRYIPGLWCFFSLSQFADARR